MRRSILAVALLVLFGVAGTQYVMQLAPTAVVTVEAVSPSDLEALGWSGDSTPGLSVVGVGELVRLSGMDMDGEEVTAYEWTITGPDGSTVTLDSTGTAWQSFRPDMAGDYEIGLTITTASGMAGASVVVTAGSYMGAGGIYEGDTAFACKSCHSADWEGWNSTGHANFFKRALDGEVSDHYAAYCVHCHTTGFDANAVNGGFDDLAEEHGWVLPEHTGEGGWDAFVAEYPAVARMANVQCEMCHGPGSEHMGAFGDPSKIDVNIMSGVCGDCHTGYRHPRFAEWQNSGHGSGTSFSRGTRAGCADCHSTRGFLAQFDSAWEGAIGEGEGVQCAACHDPHDTQNPDQLRTVDPVELNDGTVVAWGGKGSLCMNCHHGRRDAVEYSAQFANHFGPHYSNQVDMLAGANVNTFGRYIPSSIHRDAIEDTCVGCHMTPGPGNEEPGQYMLGNHSWSMNATLEDGSELDLVAACTDCHGPIESFDDLMAREDYDGDGELEDVRSEVMGLMDEVGMLLPPLGDPSVSVSPDFSVLQLRAAFNWNYVEDDRSGGLHNFQFAVGLLQLTKQVLEYGVLTEGEIVEITDIPNDQGKNVNVVWTRFGADGPSDDPLSMYYVWREGMTDAAGKTVTEYTDISQVPAKPTDGIMALNTADGYWTAVGSQPAAQMEFYGAVVPTLYDVVDGDSTMAATNFMVSGHTMGGVYVTSSPAMGYSVDNLHPMAPMGVAAAVTASEVTLTWDDPVDEDFNYFAIYRGDVAGFDTADMEPMGTSVDPLFVDTNVDVNTYYYYRIAAVDFAGNEGDTSEEVVAAVSVGVDGESPIDYALHQNYPNPFNPTTTLSFDVAATSFVQVAVYDLLGRQIQVLVNETRDAGRHSVQLNAGDLSSGLYIVRMEASGRVFERAITLIK